MSKTEHDLTSADADDALDDLFADAEFDEALNDALDEADVELDIEDTTDDSDAAAELDDGDIDDEDEATDAELDGTDVDVDDTTDDDEIVDDIDDDSTDAIRAQVDAALDAEADGEHDDDGTARHGIRPASTEAVDDDDDAEFELPDIVPATPETDPEPVDASDLPDDLDEIDTDVLVARDLVPSRDPEIDDDEIDTDDDEVSDEILEELRRADIDGPIVDLAPQDDTATARRRPRRSADYDPAPMPIPAQIPRVLGRKPRVRKVTRVVRHVDPWSVFKIALVANAVLYIIVLTAGVLLWNVAHATGTVDNVERFFESFGWASFEFDGGEIYHASWIAGLFLVIGFTGLAVLAATLFNLITDLVGGMRFTVLEEEVVETRVSPMRRFVVRRPEPEIPAVLRDESGAMIREGVVDDTGANERPSR